MASGTLNKSNQKFPPTLREDAQRAGIATLHAADFKNAQNFKNKNVLIIGVGNSGSDIATQISRVARRTVLAVRTTPWIVPLWAFGIPADVFARPTILPHWLKLKLFHRIQRLYIAASDEARIHCTQT